MIKYSYSPPFIRLKSHKNTENSKFFYKTLFIFTNQPQISICVYSSHVSFAA